MEKNELKNEEIQKTTEEVTEKNEVVIEEKDLDFEVKEKEITKKILKIHVDSSDGDKVRVNLPMSLAYTALKVGGKVNINGFDTDKYGIDVEELIKLIDEDINGELVNVESSDGDIVKIVIE